MESMTAQEIEIELKKLFQKTGLIMAYNGMNEAEVEIPVKNGMKIELKINAKVIEER